MTALILNPLGHFKADQAQANAPQKTKNKWLARALIATVLFFVLALMLVPEVAQAGSDSTFRAIVDWLVGILKGSGGLMIAIIALIVAVISLLSGRFMAVGIAFAVAIVAIYGPDVLESWFTAVF